jgi:hypothetical protein
MAAIDAHRSWSTPPAAGTVESILVLADSEKDRVRDLLVELGEWLGERVDEVRVEGDVRAFCEQRDAARDAGRDAPQPDLVIVLGGDGAMLGAVRAFRDAPVPTLGINFGRLGFLAATPATRWRDVLEGVLGGHGIVDPRMRFAAEVERPGGEVTTAIGLNDVVVSRSAETGMFTASLEVGGDWVTNPGHAERLHRLLALRRRPDPRAGRERDRGEPDLSAGPGEPPDRPARGLAARGPHRRGRRRVGGHRGRPAPASHHRGRDRPRAPPPGAVPAPAHARARRVPPPARAPGLARQRLTASGYRSDTARSRGSA